MQSTPCTSPVPADRTAHTTIVSIVLACAVAVGCAANFDARRLPHRDGAVGDGDVATLDAPTSDADTGGIDAPAETGDVPGDVSMSCGRDEAFCDGRCVNVTRDPSHCGDCITSCPGTACLGGVCTSTCRAGRLDCDGNIVNGCEVDAAVDGANCGGCGRACLAPRLCVAGNCPCSAGTADCDRNPSNGCEVVLDRHSEHCGRCGNACGPGQTCMSGSCACGAGRADCDANAANACEADTTTDARNCGACGRVCGPNSTCIAGSCTCGAAFLRCPPSAPPADGCTVSASDPMNCGACGTRCTGATPLCTTRGCAASCTATETLCAGSCVDTTSSASNCGACGSPCPAVANAMPSCSGGRCGFTCLSGFGDCDGNAMNGCEVDLRSTRTNCGACGASCSSSQSCVAGRCECPTGQRDCGGGTCADCCSAGDCADTDACTIDTCMGSRCQHSACSPGTRCCGARGCLACCDDGDCASSSGHRGCASDGTCTACAMGYRDCDANAGNGCETNVATDPANCGICGTACTLPNATPVCAAGICQVATCAAGFGDCDLDPDNGCEVNLLASVMNCGMCGRACSGAGATCSAGTCGTASCAAGTGDCDGNMANGCEATLATDTRNCGACGRVCAFARASASCSGGSCVLGSCSADYANCNGLAADGCETSIRTDPSACGGCGMACALPRATASCVSSTCRIASCQPGFGDCDGNDANGCEVELTVDVNHCGGCSTSCPPPASATRSCIGGACGYACTSGFSDCNGVPTDGCEANLSTDVDHCGTCATSCAARPNTVRLCTAGVCTSMCTTGFADCDGMVTNGCEMNLNTNAQNCGTCGIRCSGGARLCCSGVCLASCM